MPHRKPYPGQRTLFEPPELAAMIHELHEWPEASLKRLGRAIGAELIRRKRPLPLALDVGMAVHGQPAASWWMSTIADK